MGSQNTYFEIKSSEFSALTLILKTDDLQEAIEQLLHQYKPASQENRFFDDDAVVIDFGQLKQAPNARLLLQTLRDCGLRPIGYANAQANWVEELTRNGLIEITAYKPSGKITQAVPAPAVKELVKEVIREIPGPTTMLVDKPLRSGQKVYARGADLVVTAIVNQGAEIAADGNIHVYAPLRGKAMAGARGNTQARIFSTCFEPELVSIAGVYRTSENPFPADVQGKAAHIRLSDDGQEKLIFEAIKS
ncbi:septum site-determining protein MinC [Curvibacter sp. CHRR-16]|uniref:septum site-determining protein MinC n=1 Tax=Curvibacter sp. CHRR-16 TaxID=2835872 RepID=UPI001BDA04D8|nr:septum site-determining protein MinC [Curvibacter sp. CHRR-16]MBT0570271.1 septum site-determining protein MinC [Curvibacter sp. CHRR-16]